MISPEFDNDQQIIIEFTEMHCKECQNYQIGGFEETFSGISGNSKCDSGSCEINEKNVFHFGNVYGKKEENIGNILAEVTLNNEAVSWITDGRFTNGKKYECTNTYQNMINIIDNYGEAVKVSLDNKDFTFILNPRIDKIFKEGPNPISKDLIL